VNTSGEKDTYKRQLTFSIVNTKQSWTKLSMDSSTSKGISVNGKSSWVQLMILITTIIISGISFVILVQIVFIESWQNWGSISMILNLTAIKQTHKIQIMNSIIMGFKECFATFNQWQNMMGSECYQDVHVYYFWYFLSNSVVDWCKIN
jgi:hypothetical protein